MRIPLLNYDISFSKRKVEQTSVIEPLAAPVNKESPMPTRGGRVSEPEGNATFGSLIGLANEVTPEFEFSLLKVCNFLAKFNADISYAIDNVVQLGNTPFSIMFDEGVSEAKAKEMIAFINTNSKNIYRGGINSLNNDLFAQVATNGALSAEGVASKNLKFLQKVVLVAPINIRFKYNSSTYDYDPYQVPSNALGNIGVNGENLIKLNTKTYKYYSLRRLNGNPYGIPPLISSFEMIEIENELLCNMKHIIKKIGLFGFLTVMMTAPTRNQGESESDFYSRSQTYLAQVRPEVEKGFADGIVLGYKGSHEFSVEGNTTNIDGFHQIMELVTQMKMAGMKQDPLMLGRNFNVAETMARVILIKLVSQIANYQRLVASFLEDIFKMMLVMGGYSVNNILVEFDRSVLSDKLKDEQAYKQLIENRKELRDTGIISQQQYAQEVNYEKPFAKKDVDYSVQKAEDKPYVDPRVSTKPKPDKGQAQDPTGTPTTDYAMPLLTLTLGAPEYEYGDPCQCEAHSYDSADVIVTAMATSYESASHAAYSKSVKEVVALIMQDLSENGTGGSAQAMKDKILYTLFTNWGSMYGQEQTAVTNKWINQLYKQMTKDDDSKVKELYLLLGVKLVTYLKNSDIHFLTRFLTDQDSSRRIGEFIDEIYGEELPKDLEIRLAQTLEDEAWKIDRVILTTVSKMDNSTEAIRLSAAAVDSFIIVTVKDTKRCNYCAAMEGKIFSVAVAMEKIEQMVNGTPNTINTDSPFLTELFKGNDAMLSISDLTGEQLQELGYIGFTSHPNCRCKVKRYKS